MLRKHLDFEGDPDLGGDIDMECDPDLEGDIDLGGDHDLEGDIDLGGDHDLEADPDLAGDPDPEGGRNLEGDPDLAGDSDLEIDPGLEWHPGFERALSDVDPFPKARERIFLFLRGWFPCVGALFVADLLQYSFLKNPDMKRSGGHSALLLARSGTACVPHPLGDLYEPSVAHRVAAYTGVRHHGHSSKPWSGTNTPWATYSPSAGTAAKATRTVVWKGVNFGRRARSLGLPKQFKQNFVLE